MTLGITTLCLAVRGLYAGAALLGFAVATLGGASLQMTLFFWGSGVAVLAVNEFVQSRRCRKQQLASGLTR